MGTCEGLEGWAASLDGEVRVPVCSARWDGLVMPVMLVENEMVANVAEGVGGEWVCTYVVEVSYWPGCARRLVIGRERLFCL